MSVLGLLCLLMVSNHENHDALDAYPVEFWNGGKVHKISDSIIHLMRGQVFTIEGKKFFTMGGAESHDKIYRKEGISWWPREMPSNDEYEEGLANLDKVNNQVDYILSHSAPTTVLTSINPTYKTDAVTRYLETVRQNVKFGWHYFGHYHIDKDFLNYKATCLYNNIIKI